MSEERPDQEGANSECMIEFRLFMPYGIRGRGHPCSSTTVFTRILCLAMTEAWLGLADRVQRGVVEPEVDLLHPRSWQSSARDHLPCDESLLPAGTASLQATHHRLKPIRRIRTLRPAPS